MAFFSRIKKKLKETAKKVVGAGADTMFTWYALDNIADGLNFLIRDIELGLQRETITPDEAEEMFSDADTAYDLAVAKVNQTARYNPFTFAARTLIVKGADIKKQQYELNKANVLATLEEGFESESDKFTRIREEGQAQFESNQEAIAAAREEANEAFAESREEGQLESEERFREQTLLFEAIRKRNAGQTLTQEEMALLEKYGLSSQTQQREGRSQLGFGLLR